MIADRSDANAHAVGARQQAMARARPGINTELARMLPAGRWGHSPSRLLLIYMCISRALTDYIPPDLWQHIAEYAAGAPPWWHSPWVNDIRSTFSEGAELISITLRGRRHEPWVEVVPLGNSMVMSERFTGGGTDFPSDHDSSDSDWGPDYFTGPYEDAVDDTYSNSSDTCFSDDAVMRCMHCGHKHCNRLVFVGDDAVGSDGWQACGTKGVRGLTACCVCDDGRTTDDDTSYNGSTASDGDGPGFVPPPT